MRDNYYKQLNIIGLLFLLLIVLLSAVPKVLAEEPSLITSPDALASALMNAKPDDKILVGDISFDSTAVSMIEISKDVTIMSAKDTNAVLENAAFAVSGTAIDAESLTVKFVNVDFRGNESPEKCAVSFKNNIKAVFFGCSFEGYHNDYGGVFNAGNSSKDYFNYLKISLQNCSFRNNSAKCGGSIYLSGFDHNICLEASHCVFDDNSAASGGAVFAREAEIHFLDCSLTGNKYIEEDVDSPNGGAMALYNCETELDGCLIADNESRGDGAGIYSEISPLKTLYMQNCTVFGNVSANDEGISLIPSEVDFKQSSKAKIYLSSIIGKQNMNDNAELFGCFIVDENIIECEPGEENSWCLKMSPVSAKEKGLIPKVFKHVLLPEGKYLIDKDILDKIGNQSFTKSVGNLHVGDNYKKEATFKIKYYPGCEEIFTYRYGDNIILGIVGREGYYFDWWEYPEGTQKKGSKVFIGGELPGDEFVGKWHYCYRDNHDGKVSALVLLIFEVILAVLSFLIRRKMDNKRDSVTLN